jgi:hypothetical protein
LKADGMDARLQKYTDNSKDENFCTEIENSNTLKKKSMDE